MSKFEATWNQIRDTQYNTLYIKPSATTGNCKLWLSSRKYVEQHENNNLAISLSDSLTKSHISEVIL